jgi:UDP-2,3-diacylglucosamine pyrophosphatase LpxH
MGKVVMAKIPRKFAVVSDIHARSYFTDYVNDVPNDYIDKYNTMRSWCRDNGYTLYHAGDCIEGYDPDTDLEYVHSDIKTAIMESLLDNTFVAGNHDNEELGVDTAADFIRDCRRRVEITHGQRFDIFFVDSVAESNTDFWGKLSYRLDWFHMSPIGSFVRRIRTSGFENRAFDYMDKEGLRLLVCGHTHRPEITERDGMTLAVGGTWSALAKDEQRKIVVCDGYDARLVGIEEMQTKGDENADLGA